MYIGHMCSGKRRNRSFKLKQRDVVPEDEWIVVENTHDPIIDEVTWARVQELLLQNKSNRRAKTVRSEENKLPALFAGKLRCADCKAVMHPIRLPRAASTRRITSIGAVRTPIKVKRRAASIRFGKTN